MFGGGAEDRLTGTKTVVIAGRVRFRGPARDVGGIWVQAGGYNGIGGGDTGGSGCGVWKYRVGKRDGAKAAEIFYQQ